jgi:hypothetical protein
MRGDPIQRAIDEDLVRVLYAQDAMAFFTHWFAIAVLVSIYWDDMPYPQRFFACFAFYAVANCASLGLWLWRRRRPDALTARNWIRLHALRGVLLYSAPGLAIWFAFHSHQADLPVLHTVMLVTLAAGVFMSNGFDVLNFSTGIIFVLLPAIVLLFGSHNFDRTILAIVLAFFFCAINCSSGSCRRASISSNWRNRWPSKSRSPKRRVSPRPAFLPRRATICVSRCMPSACSRPRSTTLP